MSTFWLVWETVQTTYSKLPYPPWTYRDVPEILRRPLISAATFGQMPTITLLIEHGALDNGDALLMAIKPRHFSAVHKLLQEFTNGGRNLLNALLKAAASADVRLMQLLIDQGAHDTGALATAADKDHYPAVQLLLDTLPYSVVTLADALRRAMFRWLRSRYGPHSPKRLTTNDLSQVMWSADWLVVVKTLVDKNAKLSLEYCRFLEVMIAAENIFDIYFLETKARYTTMTARPNIFLLSLAIYNEHEVVDLLAAKTVISYSESRRVGELNDNSSLKPLISSCYDWRSGALYVLP